MNISENSIVDIVQEVCAHVRISEGDYGKPLKDLGVDSLDIAGIFLAIHEKLGVRVPDGDIDRLSSIRLITEYLRKK